MSELAGLTAPGLRQRLDGGELGAVELTRACLGRIEALDDRLGALLRINPDAERDAATAEKRLRDGDPSPLLGIPIVIKDNLTTVGLETTCASKVLDGFVPLRDATAVARLRKAGAIVLGKANMDEFAMGSSTENSSYRRSRNPWNTDRVPGGSSGGSAVAVAARFAPLALGSDTGGSVRQPAAFCGIVGLKPSYGRVSRLGLVAFGSSLDQVGPLATDVEGAALVLDAVAGHDAGDATSSPRQVGDYRAACRAGVAGLRIGLPEEYFESGLDPEIDAAVRAAADELARRGAQVENVSLPHTRFSVPAYYLVATAEASSNLARYDAVRYGRRVDDDRGLDAMYRASRGSGFGPEVVRRIMLGTYALSKGYYDAFYGKAMRVRTLLRRDFVELFDGGLDLVLTPTTPTSAFRLGEKTESPLAMYLADVYTVTANLAGLPAISVPVGHDRQGMPLGAQLIGPDFGEDRLFAAASVLEQRFPAGVPPWVEEHLSPGDGAAEAPV